MPFTWSEFNRSWSLLSVSELPGSQGIIGYQKRVTAPPGVSEVMTKYLALPCSLGNTPAPQLTFCGGRCETSSPFALQLQLLLLGPDIVIVLSYHLHHPLGPTREMTAGRESKKMGSYLPGYFRQP